MARATLSRPYADAATSDLVQWLRNARELVIEAERDASGAVNQLAARRRVASHKAGVRLYEAELRRRKAIR